MVVFSQSFDFSYYDVLNSKNSIVEEVKAMIPTDIDVSLTNTYSISLQTKEKD